jgi:hypothetical protein
MEILGLAAIAVVMQATVGQGAIHVEAHQPDPGGAFADIGLDRGEVSGGHQVVGARSEEWGVRSEE